MNFIFLDSFLSIFQNHNLSPGSINGAHQFNKCDTFESEHTLNRLALKAGTLLVHKHSAKYTIISYNSHSLRQPIYRYIINNTSPSVLSIRLHSIKASHTTDEHKRNTSVLCAFHQIIFVSKQEGIPHVLAIHRAS